MISRLCTADADFESELNRLLDRESVVDAELANRVDDIIAAVREDGDAALLELTNKLDQTQFLRPGDFCVGSNELAEALQSLPAIERNALEQAAARVSRYHEHQKQDSWQFRDENDTLLGQRIVPLERVGIYVPGGKASYPSTVLMNAIPARVAGVSELVMVCPTPHGERNALVLAAAAIAGVNRLYTVGGAQAVAALAYGTESIPRVDKIVGPGNAYVACAKRKVFGQVGLDMVAGPSEILIVADGHTDPVWMAMDLFSQAEHDEDAQAILLCPDRAYLDRVEAEIRRLLPEMQRTAIIASSLARRGALIEVDSLEQAMEISNLVAPEHLELSVSDPESLLPQIRHAGAIFMGRYTAEVLGDYCAGPSHVLPTSGTARFSSPLGVYDFQKRMSIVMCSAVGAAELGSIASPLARGESLEAHARAAELRMRQSELEKQEDQV